MGKSTAAGMFAELGIPVWDADEAVRRLYGENGLAVDPIGALVPGSIKGGILDRAVLRKWIADNPDGLERIEAIVHPMVAEDRLHFIKNHNESILLFDIPLLFETGADQWLHAVAVVSTDAETQKSRVLARPGMTEDRFNHINSKQMPDAEKRERADYLIPSDTLETARKAIETIVAAIRKQTNA